MNRDIFTIKIMGHVYKEELSEKLVLERNSCGTCCPNTLVIKICSSIPTSRKEETRIHEIFEALRFHLEIDLPHDKLSALSEAWYLVLKENPQLFKYGA